MTVLTLASGASPVHAQRLGLVADRLRELGVEVVDATVPDVVPDAGGAVWEQLDVETAGDIVARERAEIVRAAPQLVLTDFRPTAPISTRLEGVDHVAICGAAQLPDFDPARVFGRDRGPAAWIGRRLRTVQVTRVERSLSTLADRLGVPSPASFVLGGTTLVADLAEFLPVPEGSAARVVGPLVWTPDVVTPVPARPFVYVTVGNTGDPRLVDAAVEAFGGSDVLDVVVSLGGLTDDRWSGRHDNVYVAALVADTVMAGCVAVMHSGGSGTTYHAMRHARPAVVAPRTVDQRINTHAIVQHGLGIGVDLDEVDGPSVRAVLRQLGRESWRNEPLLEFARLATEADGPGAAAEAIVQRLDR